MLLKLIKIQFQMMFLSKMKKFNLKTKIMRIFLYIFLLLYVCFVFGMFSYNTANTLIQAYGKVGYAYLGVAFMTLLSTVVSVIFSMFNTYLYVYESKDNDFLFSLPVTSRQVLLARLIPVYIFEVFYHALLLVPTYWSYSNHTIQILPILLLMIGIILLSLFSLTLSLILSYGLSILFKRIKKFKNLFIIIVSFGAFMAYMYGVSKFESFFTNLITYGKMIEDKAQIYFYPFYHIAKALTEYNILSLIQFTLISIIPFMIVIYLIDRNYIVIATRKVSEKREKYQAKTLKGQSVLISFLKKDLSFYYNNPMVLINCGLGTFLFIPAVIIYFVQLDKIKQLLVIIPNNYQWAIAFGFALILSYISSLNSFTASGLSLEGKNFWIIKTTPIKEETIIVAKLLFQIIWCYLPIPFACLILYFTIGLSIQGLFVILFTPLLFILLEAQLGLIMNIFFPNFDFINPVSVVKSSFPSIFTSLFSISFLFVYCFILYQLKDILSVMQIVGLFYGVLIVIDLLLLLWIKLISIKRLRNLY